MKTIIPSIMMVLVAIGAKAQTVVFSDDFNRSELGPNWTTTVTAGDGDARITSGKAELTNDKSASANAAGRVYITTPTSGFDSPYQTTLNSNPGLVSWTFNMRQKRTSLGGFGDVTYGVAFVLGSTSGDLLTGSGYAIILGEYGTHDPIRLVKFTGGMDSNSKLASVVTASETLSDPLNHYMSLKVTYEPSGNTWSLYGRDDGTSSFTDPTSGPPLTSLGASAIDSTYTESTLSHSGLFWNYATEDNKTAYFDNLSITAVPEPSEYALVMGLGLLGFALGRRYLLKAA